MENKPVVVKQEITSTSQTKDQTEVQRRGNQREKHTVQRPVLQGQREVLKDQKEVIGDQKTNQNKGVCDNSRVLPTDKSGVFCMKCMGEILSTNRAKGRSFSALKSESHCQCGTPQPENISHGGRMATTDVQMFYSNQESARNHGLSLSKGKVQRSFGKDVDTYTKRIKTEPVDLNPCVDITKSRRGRKRLSDENFPMERKV